MLAFEEKQQGIVFKVFIQPRASKNMIVGIYDRAIKIKLTAPPVDNAANKMCIKYLAKCLEVPASSMEIISGRSSRTKRVLLRYGDNKPSPHGFKKIKHQIESLASSSK